MENAVVVANRPLLPLAALVLHDQIVDSVSEVLGNVVAC